MKKEMLVKLLPAIGFVLLLLCLLTKSDGLLIASALYSAVCVAVCYALAGRDRKGKEKK